ncbi:MAG: tetratricopeptide repeat protein [Burkholderiales bacterium]|nr:tetratricopeptide repeat protein [Burkholderiales bacterium]
MAFHDRRGVPCGSSSAAAREAADAALRRMMAYDDDAAAALDRAIDADPSWALPRLMKAGQLLGLCDPARAGEAIRLLGAARERIDDAPAREQAHLAALQRIVEGRWSQACALWDQLLVEHPRDGLALHWAHRFDFWRGDAMQQRARPARALPEWSADDPLQPFVLGLYAFGLEECHEYAAAEDAARQALQADARVRWAIHAVAHVMEMRGRVDDGAAWLRQHQPQWADGSELAPHLWWHAALLRIEAMDLAGALRLADSHLAGDALRAAPDRFDAAALLWRLQLLGVDVAARCRALLADWQPDPDDAGQHAFGDLHALLAMLGADDLAAAERWIAHCAARVLAATDAARDNHAVAREAGLPLMRGMLALARGQADAAAEQLYAARSLAPRLGGSCAQRELVDQTLLAAAAQGSARRLGRALLNERCMARPATALTRHWIAHIGPPEEARA